MKPPIVFRKIAKDKEVMVGLQHTFKDHKEMAERLKKTLYYGKHPKTDRPSLPMTELAVEIFSKAVPEGLGQIGMDYATSVSRNACISPCSMILAMAYIERVRRRSPDYLMQVTSSDLFLVSMMVASKFLYDEGEDEEVFNDEWARVANMENHEVNQLERNFLAAIDWNIYGSPDVFEELLYDVEYKIAVQKIKDRGWSTYTDLLVLSDKLKVVHCWPLLDSIFKVVVVSSITYVASITVMVAAAVLVNQAKSQVAQMVILKETSNSASFLAAHMDRASFQNDSSDLAQLVNSSCGLDLHCDSYLSGYRDTDSYSSVHHDIILKPFLDSLTSVPSTDFNLHSYCPTCKKTFGKVNGENDSCDNWFALWKMYSGHDNNVRCSVYDCAASFWKSLDSGLKTCNTWASTQNIWSASNLENQNPTVCIPTSIAFS